MRTWPELVQEFHTKFGVPFDPRMVSVVVKDLRQDLIWEEANELGLALDNGNRVGVADALGDLIYVVIGAAETWGIDIDRVVREIHRSNMTKEGGGRRADGKILKGPNYSPPDLEFVNGPI